VIGVLFVRCLEPVHSLGLDLAHVVLQVGGEFGEGSFIELEYDFFFGHHGAFIIDRLWFIASECIMRGLVPFVVVASRAG
jgi:hypothetical protein